MKTVIASLAAIAALSAVAAPAAAQPGYDRGDRYERGHDNHRGAWNINQRQNQIERQIERGLRRGDLTAREARRLHEDVRDVARIEARYRANGLTAWERQDLDRRLDRLEHRVLVQSRDNDRYARR